eukprot:23926-Amorphochlora_amoeboformis.AAC.1
MSRCANLAEVIFLRIALTSHDIGIISFRSISRSAYFLPVTILQLTGNSDSVTNRARRDHYRGAPSPGTIKVSQAFLHIYIIPPGHYSYVVDREFPGGQLTLDVDACDIDLQSIPREIMRSFRSNSMWKGGIKFEPRVERTYQGDSEGQRLQPAREWAIGEEPDVAVRILLKADMGYMGRKPGKEKRPPKYHSSTGTQWSTRDKDAGNLFVLI